MSGTHTPGPWTIPFSHDLIGTDGTNGPRRLIAQAHGKNLEANARLIAAAPELLDVLIDILIDQETEPGNINTWPDPPGIESAREVLKKHGLYPANIKRA